MYVHTAVSTLLSMAVSTVSTHSYHGFYAIHHIVCAVTKYFLTNISILNLPCGKINYLPTL